jgi:hypothetical protein
MDQKASVTTRSVIQRINRKLKPNLEMLKTARGRLMRSNFGDHYVIDFRRNLITQRHIDPEEMGRALGVLHEWEKVTV